MEANELESSVFLIGYRGSGKSTVGRLLAQELDCVYLDTDQIVELTIKKTIAQCFEEEGEPGFRAHESAALEAVCRRIEQGDRLVVATGGGIILDPRNAAMMRQRGVVVWLTAGANALRRRIEGDARSTATRPALSPNGTSSTEIEAILRLRSPLYRSVANLSMSTDEASPDVIASRIASTLRAGGEIRSNPAEVDG